jgi:hypothetical protein
MGGTACAIASSMAGIYDSPSWHVVLLFLGTLLMRCESRTSKPLILLYKT